MRLALLQSEAAAALAAGDSDPQRVAILVRCLDVRTGFTALAAMLRCTEHHQAWTSVTVGDLLAHFREADRHFVRRVTALAVLSPDTRWSDCGVDPVGVDG